LVVQRACVDLAVAYFPGVDVLAVDFRPFLHDLRYRSATQRRLRALGASHCHHWACPRVSFAFADSIVAALGCPATGMAGEFIDRSRIDRWWSRGLYSRLLPAPPGRHQGEYYASMSRALSLPLPRETLQGAPIPRDGNGLLPNGDYWVIAPGSSSAQRRWPIERFVSAARHVLRCHPEWHCFVVGTADERDLGEQLCRQLGSACRSLCGNTGTRQLVSVIAGSRLVLCNDSAAAHIAGHVRVPCVAIVGGGNYGLSLPYAKDSSAPALPPVCVSARMPCFGCSWICRFANPGKLPFPCVDGVATDAVVRAIDGLIEAACFPPLEATLPSSAPISAQ
jgi:ADP-heptose:LPS heptosyltransferase